MNYILIPLLRAIPDHIPGTSVKFVQGIKANNRKLREELVAQETKTLTISNPQIDNSPLATSLLGHTRAQEIHLYLCEL